MSDDMEYDEPSGDDYTPDGKLIYGSTTNDDNSYQFCLITHNDGEDDFRGWEEVSDKKYILTAYDLQQKTLVDSIEYRQLDKNDFSQGWHCVSCVGNKSETTVVLSQLFDFKAFRFVDGKFQRAEIQCDQLIRVGYENIPIRGVKISKGNEDFQMQVTRMITLSESQVSIFNVKIA